MKIAVLSSHTPSLFWFRMDMMKAFIKQGHSVFALGPEHEDEWKDKFKEHDIEYYQVYVERNGINPIQDMKTFYEIYLFMKEEKPDKVFAYQAKTIVYGSFAAWINRKKEVYLLIAGLGSIFRGAGIKNKIVKTVMTVQYWAACKISKKVFFQNKDDIKEFLNRGLLTTRQVVLINGSGVNLSKFRPAPLPEEPVFLYIGRLIRDKGVMEYLKACSIIKERFPSVRCLLVGPYDSNPSALQPGELQPYLSTGVIEYFGEQNDVRPFIAMCSAFILPSYHEGTPKTVLEAMAMGRAIITSDAPGCRETVINGENGYLVEVKNIEAIANKMEYLILHPDICKEMGKKSLDLAVEKYDVNMVNQSILRTMRLL